MTTEFVFVFNGNTSRFPSGVFRSKKKAESWIFGRKLEGTLTKYPVDESTYDWAIETGIFTVKKPHQADADLIANFSSASQDHYHYSIEDGEYKISG